MQANNETAKVGQIINWYLASAAKGDHSDTGTPKSEAHLDLMRDIARTYTPGEFRRRPFSEVTVVDLQSIIDDAAASGSEKAAMWLKNLFIDVESFANRQSVSSNLRARRLIAPGGTEEPKVLGDIGFKAAWEAYSYCASGGAVVDRGPSLAILLSGVTLQPLGHLIYMRRDEVDLERKLWVKGDPARYVHLSSLALDLIGKAVEWGDFVYRETPTRFVFPSAGAQRDPERPLSFSSTFEVVKRVLNKKATPHDLRCTGVATLRALGGEDLRAVVKTVTGAGSEAVPDATQVALVEGWSERVRQLTARVWR